MSFWKAFKDCDIGIKQVFDDLGKQAVLEDHIVKQLKDERLPPTKAAVIQAIKRLHFQRIVPMNLLLIRIYHHQSMDGERKLGELSCNDNHGSSS